MDISNSNSIIILDGSSIADTISNSGADVTINAGTGPDLISNTGASVIINGDAGRDSINNTGANVTIVGGACNDRISLSSAATGTLIKYASGEGDDSIYGFDSNDTLQISGAEYSTVFSGNDLIFKVGDGSVILKDAKDISVKIDGTLTSGEESTLPEGWTFDSTKKKITASLITAETEIDLNESYGDGVEIIDASKIVGGVEIIGNDLDNSIKGSKGDDTISGGYGNDTVSLGGGADIYIYQGGDDVIQDYSTADSIQIDTDEIEFYSMSTVGADVIFETSEGNLTIKKGAGKYLNISPYYPIICCVPPYPLGWKFDSTGTRLIATLATADDIDLINDYYAYDNDSIRVVDASKTTIGIEIIANDNGISIKGGRGDDVIADGKGNDTVSLGSGNDIFIYSGGDDVIFDYVAGRDSIQIDTLSVEITGVETVATDIIYKTSEGNLTIRKGRDKEITLIDANDEEIIFGEIPPGNGWRYDSSKKLLQATIASAENEIDLTDDYFEWLEIEKVDGSKITSGVVIYGNDLDNSIKGGKGADTISGGAGNDTVLLGAGADVYIYESGDDVIQDYSNADSIQIDTDKISVTGLSTVTSNLIIETSEGNITLKSGKGKTLNLIDAEGEEIILEEFLPNGWKYNSTKTAITATATTASNIDLNEEYGSTVTKVNASKLTSGVEIIGNDSRNSIKGGSGNDTIYGGDGNDTISLGGGADIYIYSGGDDVIQDYSTADSIKIYSDEIKITGVETVGSNVIISTSEGNIKVKGGSGKKINLVDSTGEEIILEEPLPDGWKYNSTKTAITATATNASNIDLTKDYGSAVTKVNASKLTKGVSIIGNDWVNSIKGGKGNDTIYGGEGNDTVSLGGGADVYIYNGGNDLIQDYTAGQDSIKIDTSKVEIEHATYAGNNLVLSTDAGNLTIKNGSFKQIALTDLNGNKIDYSGKFPEGWKYDGAKNLLQATLATADDIDLTENYGVEIEIVDASKLTKGVEIYGNDLDNSIKGSKGADTIFGGEGDDTISLGGGADIYIYQGGDDVITDYAAGADSIQIDTSDILINAVETIGADVVYFTNAGNLTVTKGASKDITVVDHNGEKISVAPEFPKGWKYDGAKNLLQATISSAVDEIDLNEEYGAEIEIVDASKLTKGVEIVGNDLDNSIKGSKGADTIFGGEGDDTISLGGGADVYIYQGGDDLILDYATADAIQIDTTDIKIDAIETIGADIIYKTSEGNITLKNGKGKTLNLIDANGEELYLNGRVAENIWFLEDDNNFVASDIASITEEKFAVTNIETQDYSTLAQDENILTFAKEK